MQACLCIQAIIAKKSFGVHVTAIIRLCRNDDNVNGATTQIAPPQMQPCCSAEQKVLPIGKFASSDCNLRSEAQKVPGKASHTVLVKDLGTSLEPDWLLEGDTVLGQQLWGQASQGSQHSPPGVDDLNLPVPADQRGKFVRRDCWQTMDYILLKHIKLCLSRTCRRCSQSTETLGHSTVKVHHAKLPWKGNCRTSLCSQVVETYRGILSRLERPHTDEYGHK